MRNQLFALVFVVIILMGGVGAIKAGYQTSVQESTTAQSYNESFTVDTGNTTEFSQSNRDVVYNDSVTVTQGGQTYQEDGNYTWRENNGTLFVPSGSGLTDNETAYLDYKLNEPEAQQKVARDVGMVPVNLLGGTVVELLGLFMLLGAAVVFIRMGGR